MATPELPAHVAEPVRVPILSASKAEGCEALQPEPGLSLRNVPANFQRLRFTSYSAPTFDVAFGQDSAPHQGDVEFLEIINSAYSEQALAALGGLAATRNAKGLAVANAIKSSASKRWAKLSLQELLAVLAPGRSNGLMDRRAASAEIRRRHLHPELVQAARGIPAPGDNTPPTMQWMTAKHDHDFPVVITGYDRATRWRLYDPSGIAKIADVKPSSVGGAAAGSELQHIARKWWFRNWHEAPPSTH